MNGLREFVTQRFSDVSEQLDWDRITDPCSLFCEVQSLLLILYIEGKRSPLDSHLICSLYGLAWACVTSGDGDLSTAAAVGFYEDLALHWKLSKESADGDFQAIVRDIPKYLSAEDFDGFTELYRYYLDESQVKEFRAELYGACTSQE